MDMTDPKTPIFYVSPSGCDENPGTAFLPFRTPERAQAEARRNVPAEVVFCKGCYRTSLNFTEADSGCTYRTEENAVFTGGISISPESLVSPSDEILRRFSPEAADHIRAVDLAALGITREELEIYPIGSYSSAGRYDNGKTGVNIEVFSGGKRMTNARYPNDGYLKIAHVLDQGEVNEYPPQNYWRENQKKRNPRGGTYLMDPDTNERAKTWQNPEPWVFGYFYWDWADSSTPAELFTPNRAIIPRYVSLYGCRPGGLYYFYNILEELDAPGEFFIDRENLVLYVYPYSENDTIEMSLSSSPLINASGADNLTIDGFTLTCVRSTAAVLNGNGCVLRNLTIRNAADHGITVTGNRNTVKNCDISHTGRGGVYLTGGDRTTLTPGENRVENCFIHDFSEVYQTYQPGVQLNGVGNICAHSEICVSPHMAIGYSGNDHLIEYNFIHDVVLHSSDAGAIYSGFDWCAHGTVIRYNLLRDIGAGEFTPDGIYWDDGHSGQTAYGNILINVKKFSFLIGGGRDNAVRDNLIFGNTRNPIHYDDRNRDGFVNGGWAAQATNSPDAPHWVKLRAIPYTNEYWKARFPQLALLKTDIHTDPDDPDFPINPAGSLITNNVIIAPSIGYIADSVYRYSRVEHNLIFETAEEAGLNTDTLEFTRQPEGFPAIPVKEIGRIPAEA